MSPQHEGENREFQEDKKHRLPGNCVPGGEKYNILQRQGVQVSGVFFSSFSKVQTCHTVTNRIGLTLSNRVMFSALCCLWGELQLH